MPELVVLVDNHNNFIGTAPKESVHTKSTPLHRGFSLFLFNSKKQLLITKRAQNKTFPLLWTNTVCGHPKPDENDEDAAKMRLKEELGIEVEKVKEAAPYKYSFTDQNGIRENEICPILIAFCDCMPKPNIKEVAAWKWIRWEDFLQDIRAKPSKYSPWCVEEGKILNKFLIS